MQIQKHDERAKLLGDRFKTWSPLVKRLAPINVVNSGVRAAESWTSMIFGHIYAEANRTPAIMECTHLSLFSVVLAAASLDLMPGAALGHLWMIPFRDNKAGVRNLTPVVGYQGYKELWYRNPRVAGVSSGYVLEGDQWSWKLGSKAFCDHTPGQGKNRALIGAFATVTMDSGYEVVSIVREDEASEARARSSGAKKSDSPWNHPQDVRYMWVKTAFRRIKRDVPSTPGVSIAERVDSVVDAEAGDNPKAIIDATLGGNDVSEWSEIEEEKERLSAEEMQKAIDAS